MVLPFESDDRLAEQDDAAPFVPCATFTSVTSRSSNVHTNGCLGGDAKSSSRTARTLTSARSRAAAALAAAAAAADTAAPPPAAALSAAPGALLESAAEEGAAVPSAPSDDPVANVLERALPAKLRDRHRAEGNNELEVRGQLGVSGGRLFE